MSNKSLTYTVSIAIISLLIIIQSVLYPIVLRLSFFPDISLPDISLIALVFFSINLGKIMGETMGFITGLVLDSLSGVPFGTNALVRLIIGFILGFFKGKIFLDKFILPSIIITISTVSKYVLYHLVEFIFPIELNIHLISFKFLQELGVNIVVTPLFFMFFTFIIKKINRD